MRRINTARGVYELRINSEPEPTGDAVGVTLVLERADGIERVSMRCLIPAARLPDDGPHRVDSIEARLAEWLMAGFEQIREAALKSIRSERRLWEARFIDGAGPWRTG